MPETLVLNGGETRHFDAPLRSVQVGVGSVIVTDGHDSTTVAAEDDTHDCGGKASLAFYSPDGANLSVVYADEVSAPQKPARRASGVSAKRVEKRAKKS